MRPESPSLFSTRWGFPFLFGGTFIEAFTTRSGRKLKPADFPSFSEGLSLRPNLGVAIHGLCGYFPSFSEGLSLRLFTQTAAEAWFTDFPSFSEGLSLRRSR